MKYLKFIIPLFLVFATPFLAKNTLADTFQVAIENDVFLDSDSDYTHGSQILWKKDDSLWIFDNWGIDLIQNMYTPGNIESPEIQYGDRPYCGLLMGSFLGENVVQTKYGNLNIQQELGLGLTGKDSLAEAAQKEVHTLIQSRTPRGWDHQIAEEPVIQYQSYFDLNYPVLKSKYFTIYGIPYVNVLLGTFKDQISLGADLKFGLNPKENMGNIISFSAPYLGEKKNIPRLYCLVGAEEKYVAHDTSLDGTVFRKSEYTIASKDFVTEFHAGFALEYWKLGINFLYIARTHEYVGQDETPNYCRLSFNINF